MANCGRTGIWSSARREGECLFLFTPSFPHSITPSVPREPQDTMVQCVRNIDFAVGTQRDAREPGRGAKAGPNATARSVKGKDLDAGVPVLGDRKELPGRGYGRRLRSPQFAGGIARPTIAFDIAIEGDPLNTMIVAVHHI